eukprot:CAMPEP_0173385468 /NCGR_PEP_ID=MMETSP1356-20130122/8074_1 /TAXON_ID=77927 ORGANISM="Hemiselmis virescens, Strain PCC157" /NCGR_SAMPLE_ID=MMETSP1356 /ASSEMBLY_ACC=CAM_ASM_000847 /LENGTH=267 /DNA_ID=CAMNT_0014341279 /DNA_START=29 /DNA_END=832 /DNA_ORIENTATION=+
MGDASPPNGYNGLLNHRSAFLNPGAHVVGPSPVMHQHLHAAMQRPWNNSTPVKGAKPGSYSSVPSADDAVQATNVSTLSQDDTPRTVEPNSALPQARIFKADEHVPAVPRPQSDKENAGNSQAEDKPWWDFFPQLSMCAMSQLGCCSGAQGDTMTRRKALCGVGIVFSEANHGALVVQQVVPRSPAFDCGRIEVGDELMTIGSKNVYRQNADAITPLVLGEEGTDIEMTFLRRLRPGSSPFDKGEQIQVTLTRRFFGTGKVPGYINP